MSEHEDLPHWCKFCQHWTKVGYTMGQCDVLKKNTSSTETCGDYALKEEKQ